MTSMLDQHEQASQRGGGVRVAGARAPLATSSSGYVSLAPDVTDTPIFSKQKMNFSPSDVITHIAVASDYLVLAMVNGKVFRIHLKNPDKHEEISITKYIQANTKLSGIFLDPLGCHLLLSFAAKGTDAYPELLYVHRKSSKLKSVNKSKTYEVTEVAWNFENKSESSSGAILLGTSKGLILETEIGPDGDKMFQSGIEQYWKQVFDIGKGTQTPITGLEFHRIGHSSKYVIFVTTPKRLYQFMGHSGAEERPLLQPIFNSYLNVPETGFQEIPSSLSYSRLQFYHSPTSATNTPTLFAWLTEPGIFHGQLDSLSQENSNSSVTHGELLVYPPFSKESASPRKSDAPLSFVLTEFHAILLYEDHCKAVCLLNQELVYEDYFSESFGKLINIVKDPVKRTIWAITTKAVFRYKVFREERNVWQIYADKDQFDLAKKYCDNNPLYVDKINVKHAELLFNKEEYERSAEVYANTQTSFEAICLKFLQAQKIEALMLFLKMKLDTLKSHDKIQTTMLVVWIVELYLSQISHLSINSNKLESSKSLSHLQTEFELFLATPKVTECIKRNKAVIYDLMASHGDKENLIKLTVINKDFENVVRQNIYMKAYTEALNVLKTQGKRELFYQFTPILIQEIPRQTVTALMEQGKSLSPARLLPALISCDPDEAHVKEMIRYLEFCVQKLGCTEPAIHNYLLSLYTSHDPAALMPFLASQGQTASMVNYDIHYALRLCREKKLTEACVQLSSLLGLWESAVELALTLSLELAKQIADMPEDQQLRKKLWLKIAQFVISGKEEIQQGMQFLQQCDLLRIEDILPFFSDFVTIDHFREPICNSLQEYNQQIQDLREEMEDATKSADQVRGEIQTFRNRCTVISMAEACVLCDITLLLRPFYLFPCGHKFHSDCLLAELQPLLGPAKKNKLADLQRQLSSVHHSSEPTGFSGSVSSTEHIRGEIDSILASECLYCGEHMIQAIDTPFIPDGDWDRVMKEWE